MDASSAPPTIVAFLSRLAGAGCALVSYEASGRSDQLGFFSCPPSITVRVVCDRGQWFVEVGRQGWSETFDADVWVAVLDGEVIGFEPSSLEAQVDALVARWVEIGASDDSALNSLLSTRRFRARSRLGFRADGGN